MFPPWRQCIGICISWNMRRHLIFGVSRRAVGQREGRNGPMSPHCHHRPTNPAAGSTCQTRRERAAPCRGRQHARPPAHDRLWRAVHHKLSVQPQHGARAGRLARSQGHKRGRRQAHAPALERRRAAEQEEGLWRQHGGGGRRRLARRAHDDAGLRGSRGGGRMSLPAAAAGSECRQRGVVVGDRAREGREEGSKQRSLACV